MKEMVKEAEPNNKVVCAMANTTVQGGVLLLYVCFMLIAVCV